MRRARHPSRRRLLSFSLAPLRHGGGVLASGLSQINGRLGERHVERFHRVDVDREIFLLSRARTRVRVKKSKWRSTRQTSLRSSFILSVRVAVVLFRQQHRLTEERLSLC